ncbi:hypothetical protein DFH09DRAFT_812720, partial [Mycena vulgaris]
FHEAMERQRSNTYTRLRTHSGLEIFDCTAADLSSIESHRDKFRQMIGYVESDDGSSRYELFNVPLLHKGYSGKFDVHTVFRGPMLHLARWAASADANLSARGAQTGINRHSDLEKYIQYLQSGLDKRKASVLNLFREWGELFFPESEMSLAGKNADDGRAEHTMKDVMDLLDADAE